MSSQTRAFFVPDGDGFVPTPRAVSPWSERMLAGPCVAGLIARELERHGADGLIPSRLTVDLFAPVRNEPVRFVTEVVRAGNRIRVVDTRLVQGDDDTTTARGTAVFLRPTEQPPGTVWTRAGGPVPPPLADADGRRTTRWFGSDDHPDGWSTDRREHQNASRKRLFGGARVVVEGEEPSPFVVTATVCEGTSLVTNWSDRGVGYINGDLTLALSRLPVGVEVGVEADNHVSADGIAVGTAVLFDRSGPFGTGVVTALANARRAVDFG